jgi:hypothetical protein
MKEDFLHYLWKFRKFDVSNLQSSTCESITILHSGDSFESKDLGFSCAQILVSNQHWIGNIAVCIQSSDFIADKIHGNVILLVVWDDDAKIPRNPFPILELRHYVSAQTVKNYQNLMLSKSWIFCESQLRHIDRFVWQHYSERLFFERLEKKSEPITELLKQTHSDWEAALFYLLTKNFGLNTNGDAFMKIAQSLPFSVIRKESHEVENLEALLLGQAGLLDGDCEDAYFIDLRSRFGFLSHKYQIPKAENEPVQFFRHRPDNFPTIRLSQLANLYASRKQLFAGIVESVSVIMLYEIFGVSVTDYWKTHYRFGRANAEKEKQLSKSFIDLLIVNTVIPLQFAYAKSQGRDATALVELISQLSPENNAVIDKFTAFGLRPENAFESQALLQLKSSYCDKARCLDCTIGMELLKSNPINV